MYLILEEGKSIQEFHNDVYPMPGILAPHCFNDMYIIVNS